MTRTLQETFDFVCTKLIEQGEPSFDEAAHCLYRLKKGDKTLKCAVGWLIPDEQYDPALEGQTIRSSMFDGLFDDLFVKRDLLGRLQSAHDDAARVTYGKPEDWLAHFKARADRCGHYFGLDTSVLYGNK